VAAISLVVFMFIILMFVAIAFIPSISEATHSMESTDTVAHLIDLSGNPWETYVEVEVEVEYGVASFYFLSEKDYEDSYPYTEAMAESSIEHATGVRRIFVAEENLPPGKYYIVIEKPTIDTKYSFKVTHFPWRMLIFPGLIVGISGAVVSAVAMRQTGRRLRNAKQELEASRVVHHQQQYRELYGTPAPPPGYGGYGSHAPPRGGGHLHRREAHHIHGPPPGASPPPTGPPPTGGYRPY
jgi:hypothetical protein